MTAKDFEFLFADVVKLIMQYTLPEQIVKTLVMFRGLGDKI